MKYNASVGKKKPNMLRSPSELYREQHPRMQSKTFNFQNTYSSNYDGNKNLLSSKGISSIKHKIKLNKVEHRSRTVFPPISPQGPMSNFDLLQQIPRKPLLYLNETHY